MNLIISCYVDSNRRDLVNEYFVDPPTESRRQSNFTLAFVFETENRIHVDLLRIYSKHFNKPREADHSELREWITKKVCEKKI